jgi:hypothetical protein
VSDGFKVCDHGSALGPPYAPPLCSELILFSCLFHLNQEAIPSRSPNWPCAGPFDFVSSLRSVAGAAPRSDAGQGTGEPSRPSFSERAGVLWRNVLSGG